MLKNRDIDIVDNADSLLWIDTGDNQVDIGILNKETDGAVMAELSIKQMEFLRKTLKQLIKESK